MAAVAPGGSGSGGSTSGRSGKAISVAVVDDQELIVEGITAMLESAPDLRVVLQARHGGEFVQAVRDGARIDVALVDIRMPLVDGLSAVRTVAALPDPPTMVVLTTFDDEGYVTEALQAGAAGFLLKRCSREQLVAAVRAAHQGDAVLAPEVTRAVIRRMLDPEQPVVDRSVLEPLSDREVEVLRCIGSGMTNGEIAAELRLSGSTVKTHVSRVLAKTGCRDRVQAVLLAVRTRLAEP
ncbi:MAG: response regulator transcription factor [Angustibacter sp.]